MIVLHQRGRLLLVKQLDHAGLAGRFAEEWGNDRFEAPAPRGSVVLAAGRHDEGWRESDDGLRYDPERRAPLYFLDGTLEDYVTLYTRGIARLAELDPYAGLLVSMHGTGNVCGRWGLQPGIRLSRYDPATWPPLIERFVLEQEAFQARLKLRILGLSPEGRRSVFERRLWSNWELLQAWDRLSLFACRSDPGERSEAEIGIVPRTLEGPETATLKVRSTGAGALVVEPWPFRTAAVDVEVPRVAIEDRPYGSREEVASAVALAPAERVCWRLQATG